MRAKLVGLVLAASVATPADARPYKEVCDNFEPFRKIAGLKYVKPVVRVAPKSEAVKPQDVVFTLAAKAGPIRIVPAADGTVELPFTDALCAENPDFASNQPEGSVRFSVSIDPGIPPARTLEYRELEALRREWDEAVSRQKLMFRLLAPSPKGYHLAFEPGKAASAEVRLAQGPRRFVADANGDLFIPFEPAWAAANPAVVLSEMPKRVGLRFKGHD